MRFLIATIWMWATAMTVVSADPVVPALAANPFEHPAWLGDATEVAEPSAPSQRVRLDLRATIVGKRPLANVGGRIVTLGDEVEGGYQLVAISEGAAEFSDGDEIIRVTVLGDDQEDNND
ncbi:MAG: hypothetical protein OEQ74_09730 [Gammaproteobacteria bacterium]|nr:hypothetical protein [Gammaproteobacteria bacterium]